MSKGEIIDFVVLRIENELDKYEKTETIPHTVLEGTYSINEIRDHYYHKLDPRYQKLADTLYDDYRKHIGQNIDSLRKALRREYTSVVSSLATEHDSFRFKEITNLYRPDMNPVRALYYQTRELFRRFNSEDPDHYWLKDLITDREYNNIILDALGRDIARLERVIKRYYMPLVENSSDVPLELFHARQTLKDFRHYYGFFEGALYWQPDE
jgi:hypothetical protein